MADSNGYPTGETEHMPTGTRNIRGTTKKRQKLLRRTGETIM